MKSTLWSKLLYGGLMILVLALGAGAGYGIRFLTSGALAGGPEIETGDFSAMVAEAQQPLLIFTSSTCPHCKNALAWLDQHGVPYARLEIDTSPEARARFKELGASGVPLAFSATQRVLGFSESLYAEAFAGLIPAASMASVTALASRRDQAKTIK